MYAKFFKRVIDFTLSLMALIVLFPLLIVLAIVGAVAMGGNPFFTQLRPGKIDKKTGQEKIFKLVKFRTMSNKKDENGELLRSSIIHEMGLDYVRTAYSHGNSRWMVIRGHVLRNALLPVVTYLAMSLADIVASSIIVEQVFALPGLGRLLVTSISNRDFPVALCIVVIIAFVVVFMNYLADVVTQYIDPRVRLD